jgi:tetratricopeptide (TPR) repeat protein
LNIKTKSISYFEKSIEKKNPLAHANLANRYIEQGFDEQAETLLKKADELSKDGQEVHQNVGYSKNKLRLLREEDEQKEKEVLALAEKKQKFKVKHAEAYCLKPQAQQVEISGTWKVKDIWNVKFVFDKGKNEFVGCDQIEKEESISSGFASLLLGTQGLGMPTGKIKIYKIRKIKIEGQIKNFSGSYTLTITEEKKDAPSYEKPEEIYSAKGLFIINDTSTTIEAMEEDNKKQCYFEHWIKQ